MRPFFVHRLQWLPYFHSSPSLEWAVRRKRYAPLSPPWRIGSLICQEPVLFKIKKKKKGDSIHTAIIGKIIDFLTSISSVFLANVKEGLLIVLPMPRVANIKLKEAYCAALYFHLPPLINDGHEGNFLYSTNATLVCLTGFLSSFFFFYG